MVVDGEGRGYLVGLSTNPRPLFSLEWVDGLKQVPESAMAGSVQFYDPATGSAVYDPATNTYVTVPAIIGPTSIPARVQPIRSASSKNNLANDTTVQNVLVSIPIDIGRNIDLRPRHRGKVLSAPLMPVLSNFVYVVQEIMDSSNPIERTFYFTVNQEAKAN